MSRPCTVCSSPLAGEINAMLADRRSVASVAVAFGLGPDAMLRHARAHLDRSVGGTSPKLNGADPLDELVTTLRGKALAGDPGIVREYRLALTAQQAAQHASAPPLDLGATPEWVKLRSAILKALEPFPEARTAVAAAVGDE